MPTVKLSPLLMNTDPPTPNSSPAPGEPGLSYADFVTCLAQYRRATYEALYSRTPPWSPGLPEGPAGSGGPPPDEGLPRSGAAQPVKTIL